jgi:aspartate/methionine/tyrosine aminotransferase
VLLILVNPGDEVLVPDPGFPAYATIVRLAGGSPVAYPLRPEERFAIRAENVAPRVTSRTRLIIVNSPHNPTGAVASEAELRALADLCRAEDLTAISDEVYREIVYDGPAGSLSRYHDRTVVVDSLSKAYSMTGWRLGWCVAPPELARLVVTFNQLAISCPPAVCQRAALLALGGVADEEKAANLRELGARRALAARRLEEETGFPVVLPRGAFYLYPDISSKLGPGRTSLDVALDLIKREKVITIPGLAFGRGTEGFLRVSFAAEPAAIEEGIRRLGRFFGRA